MAKSVTEVWSNNMGEEFKNIRTAICNGFSSASFDTEFPGTIYDPIPSKAYSRLPQQEYYSIMKRNVDYLEVIQLGLTLVDGFGNYCVWQFNFSDFDPEIHPHNKDSISLLQQQGIDFSLNKLNGIKSHVFARYFKEMLPHISLWTTFHGSYDYALLVKVLTGGSKLPDNVLDFLGLVNFYFRGDSFDVKLVASDLGYNGGLEKVAKGLEVDRVAGKNHQAGSDSLLTMHVFAELNKRNTRGNTLRGLNRKVYGLINGKETKACYAQFIYLDPYCRPVMVTRQVCRPVMVTRQVCMPVMVTRQVY